MSTTTTQTQMYITIHSFQASLTKPHSWWETMGTACQSRSSGTSPTIAIALILLILAINPIKKLARIL